MRSAIFAFLLLLILAGAFQQAHAVTIGPNVDIAGETSPDRQRVEPTIAIDPHNPKVIVAGAQDLRLKEFGGHRWHGYYRSTDGGRKWSSSLLPGFPGDTSPEGLASPLRAVGAILTSDPILAFDRNGNVYYAGIAITQTFTLVAFVAKFVNDGADYAGLVIIGGTNFADKPWITVDTTGGPNDGTVYLAFDGSFPAGPSGLVFTRSTDGGRNFATPFIVMFDGALPGVTVDPTGNIFVSAISTGGHNVLVARSGDGGLSFQRPVMAAFPITPLPSPLPGNSFRTTTIPQISSDNRGVYVVWDDFTTKDSDVLFIRSTDGGITWTSPIRVNDMATDQQFMSSVAASGGRIDVIWYDSRLGQLANGTITGLNLFYSFSLDGGASFSASIRVSSASFDPNLVARESPGIPFMGDYIQVAASPTAVHPIWTDNRNACSVVDPTFGCVDQDAFTATITF